jgi:hypothetical protein
LILQFGRFVSVFLQKKTRLLILSDSLTGLASEGGLPDSIVKCKTILRTIHITIREYLEVVRRGGNVATEVPRVRLVSFLGTAPPADPQCSTAA